jgi:hypothetical protein
MKEITSILFSLLFLASLPSTAQEQRWQLKPMVGMTLSSLVGDTAAPSENTPMAGWGCGAEAEYRLSDRWNLSLGALFTKRRAKSDVTVGYYDGQTFNITESRYSTVFNQIDIPLMAHLQLTKGLTAGIGLQPTLLLSARQNILKDGDFYVDADNAAYLSESVVMSYKNRKFLEKGTSTDIKGRCRMLGMDVPVGVAYSFDRVELGLRYSFGLFNAIHGCNVQSRCLMLSLGYRFGI